MHLITLPSHHMQFVLLVGAILVRLLVKTTEKDAATDMAIAVIRYGCG